MFQLRTMNVGDFRIHTFMNNSNELLQKGETE
jgi:hypothetical protein